MHRAQMLFVNEWPSSIIIITVVPVKRKREMMMMMVLGVICIHSFLLFLFSSLLFPLSFLSGHTMHSMRNLIVQEERRVMNAALPEFTLVQQHSGKNEWTTLSSNFTSDLFSLFQITTLSTMTIHFLLRFLCHWTTKMNQNEKHSSIILPSKMKKYVFVFF